MAVLQLRHSLAHAGTTLRWGVPAHASPHMALLLAQPPDFCLPEILGVEDAPRLLGPAEELASFENRADRTGTYLPAHPGPGLLLLTTVPPGTSKKWWRRFGIGTLGPVVVSPDQSSIPPNWRLRKGGIHFLPALPYPGLPCPLPFLQACRILRIDTKYTHGHVGLCGFPAIAILDASPRL